SMIHTHSLGLAARRHPERTALADAGRRPTFRELHDRVGRIAGRLRAEGLRPGDRLALLLPNSLEHIEPVYACAWLGVAAVPLNTRLSAVEIDRILADAQPRGLIRHSSLPAPTAAGVALQLVLDRDALNLDDGAAPEPIDDPDAALALVYTSGTT